MNSQPNIKKLRNALRDQFFLPLLIMPKYALTKQFIYECVSTLIKKERKKTKTSK